MIAARRQVGVPKGLWVCALALLAAPSARAEGDAGLFGGSLAATSDYIYRGMSQSDGHGALQADLHASSSGGTFGGVWASTRDSGVPPGNDAETQLYLGQHIALGSAWSATLSGRAVYYVGGTARHSYDYQEISATFTWLDRYTLSLTAIPNAVRYVAVPPAHYELYRTAAFVADGAGQWLLSGGVLGGNLYLTAAAGYYYASAADDPAAPGRGYLYGNAGLALEWRGWRLDVGYFATQDQAAEFLPYPVANRFAGTLVWQF